VTSSSGDEIKRMGGVQTGNRWPCDVVGASYEPMSETSDEDDTRTDHQSETEDRRAEELSEDNRGHLAEVEDGCGCAEVWEHLSERRQSDD
jgi:hypothetical protein